jgi:hypothetical protein
MSATALTRGPAARARIGAKSNATLKSWCAKHGVEIIRLNERAIAVCTEQLERSLEAACASGNGKELA